MNALARYWAPAAWMAVIFLFSTSIFGGGNTASLIDTLIRLLYPAVSSDDIELINFTLRKSAHFTEYAILALLWHRALYGDTGRGFITSAAMSLAVCVVYAATDEYHQSFVPNRTASVTDVMIDSAGAAFMVAVLWAKKTRADMRAVRG